MDASAVPYGCAMSGGVAGRRWEWLGWPVRSASSATVSLEQLRAGWAAIARPASFAARAIPPVLVVVGLAVAVLSATVVEDAVSEGIATFGVEAGAALWFGGAVALSLRRTTVARGLLVLAAALGGLVLIGLALLRGWTGAPLDLAMEFGVGALAIPVLDVVVLGVLQPALEGLGRGPVTSVEIELARRWPPVALHVDRRGEEGEVVA